MGAARFQAKQPTNPFLHNFYAKLLKASKVNSKSDKQQQRGKVTIDV